MKAAIVGYGIEGKINYQYWKSLGADITICDQDTTVQPPEGVPTQLGKGYLKNLGSFDVIVRSAGVNPDAILAENPGVKDRITTTIDTFIRICPTRYIIGVTGTKGKGTTSALIAKMLEAAGKQVFLGGNMGTSPLEFLEQISPDSWVVLELSSFQLCDIRHSPSLAVCLMVVPEHLNWHRNLQEYLDAKSQLFACQKPGDTAIYFADDERSHDIVSHSPGKKICYYAEPGAFVMDNKIVIDNAVICETSEIRLLGTHNWQNVCAAVTAVWQVIRDIPAIRSVITTFAGLPHRLEFVRTVDGVDYYDDSFGTTPETAVVAIKAFTRPKILILGGSDKGTFFDKLAVTITSQDIRHVILIGDTAGKIRAELLAAGYPAEKMTLGLSRMPDIVADARAHAQNGDVVLLSTGCASFGLFKNYKDRAAQFHTAVGALQ